MPWTETLPSGRYRAGYRTPTGEKRYVDGTFTHKRAAEREAAAAETAARAPGWRDPRAAERTWGDWVEEWQRGSTVVASTRASTGYMITRRLLPKWGKVKLIDIDRHEIKAWANELQADGLAPTSAKRLVNVLSSSLTAAVDARILPANPCIGLRLNIPDQRNERVYTTEEQHRLFQALPGEIDRALVAVLLGTGCRLGEALALEARHFNAEQGTVRIRQTWDSGTSTLKPYTKGKTRRTVPLDAWLLEIIEPVLKARPTGYIFASKPGGDPLDVANWRKRVWNPAATAANLNPPGVERGSIHTLRHTYATEQLEAGLSLAEIADLLGHRSITTTERYAHRRSKVGRKALGTIRDPRTAPKRRPAAPETRQGTAEVIPFPRAR